MLRVYEPLLRPNKYVDGSECVAPHLNVVELSPHIQYDEVDVNSMLCTIKTGGECTLNFALEIQYTVDKVKIVLSYCVVSSPV